MVSSLSHHRVSLSLSFPLPQCACFSVIDWCPFSILVAFPSPLARLIFDCLRTSSHIPCPAPDSCPLLLSFLSLFALSVDSDPHSASTLSSFHRVINRMCNGDNQVFSSRAVSEGLLSAFASIDAPVPPSHKAHSLFVKGIIQSRKQEYRQRLLEVLNE